jgi:hypothetical protein
MCFFSNSFWPRTWHAGAGVEPAGRDHQLLKGNGAQPRGNKKRERFNFVGDRTDAGVLAGARKLDAPTYQGEYLR